MIKKINYGIFLLTFTMFVYFVSCNEIKSIIYKCKYLNQRSCRWFTFTQLLTVYYVIMFYNIHALYFRNYSFRNIKFTMRLWIVFEKSHSEIVSKLKHLWMIYSLFFKFLIIMQNWIVQRQVIRDECSTPSLVVSGS